MIGLVSAPESKRSSGLTSVWVARNRFAVLDRTHSVCFFLSCILISLIISILDRLLVTLFVDFLTLRTSEAGILTLRKLPYGVGSRYTGGTVWQCQASDAGIPALFSNAYWHLNARVIEIQTRQQLKKRIFVNKFCIWTPNGQRTS